LGKLLLYVGKPCLDSKFVLSMLLLLGLYHLYHTEEDNKNYPVHSERKLYNVKYIYTRLTYFLYHQVNPPKC